MKRIFRGTALALALMIILLFGGCSGKLPPESKAQEPSEPAPITITAKTLYEQGEELVAEVVEIAGSREYLRLYTENEEVLNILADAVEGKDYTAPDVVYSIQVSQKAMDKTLETLGLENIDDLPDSLKRRVRERSFQSLPTQLNAMNGTNTLAATSICTAGKIFVNSEVTQGVIYLYTYHNGVPVAVTFLPGEDGAVSASGTFVFYDQLPVGSLEEMSGLLEMLGVEITEVIGS